MRVYAFDVFDTLITRPLLRPTDVFVLVGMRLAREGTDCDPLAFGAARRRAEAATRQRRKSVDDCRLMDIYDRFPELAHWGISPAEAMAAELAVEQTLACPIAENIALVRSLRVAGERVIFLSDMYLPTAFIRDLLTAQGIDVGEDLFVSGDLGVAKHTGRLYALVCARFCLRPEQLHHLGDNPRADYARPVRLGVRAALFRGSWPTAYERIGRGPPVAQLRQSASAGLARATRLGAVPEPADVRLHALVCDLVAPLVCAFVRWLLADARATGIQRLYFVSRDGQVLLGAAQALREPGDPACRYLYGSRRAWLLAGVTDVATADLEWAWRADPTATLDDLLRRLDLDAPGTHALLADNGIAAAALRMRPTTELLTHLRALLRGPVLGSRLAAAGARRRALLTAYLRQEGLFDGTPWALVDLGWGLRCQRAIQQVLHAAEADVQARGWYLGIAAEHAPLDACGEVHALASHPAAGLAAPLRCTWLFRRGTVALIEHLFVAADHPSVVGYRQHGGRVLPCFDEESPGPRQLAVAALVRDAVARYAAGVPMIAPVLADREQVAVAALARVRRFCVAPVAADAAAAAGTIVNLSHDHHSAAAQPLARRLTPGEFLALALSPGAAPPVPWLPGALALSGPLVRLSGRLLIAGMRLIAASRQWGRVVATRLITVKVPPTDRQHS